MTTFRFIVNPNTNLYFMTGIRKGYYIEIHDVNGGVEIGVYKLKELNSVEKEILHPPYRLEIPLEELQDPKRFKDVLPVIDDIIDSIKQDSLTKKKKMSLSKQQIKEARQKRLARTVEFEPVNEGKSYAEYLEEQVKKGEMTKGEKEDNLKQARGVISFNQN